MKLFGCQAFLVSATAARLSGEEVFVFSHRGSSAATMPSGIIHGPSPAYQAVSPDGDGDGGGLFFGWTGNSDEGYVSGCGQGFGVGNIQGTGIAYNVV